MPNRDVGLQLQGDLFAGVLRYEAGVFNGVADGGSGDVEASDDEKDFAGRLFATPSRTAMRSTLRGLGFGVAGTYGNQEGAGLVSKYKTTGQQQFFSYRSGAGTARPRTSWPMANTGGSPRSSITTGAPSASSGNT